MKARMVLHAFFSPRNILLILLVLLPAGLMQDGTIHLPYIPVYVKLFVPAGLLSVSTIQLLLSSKFHEKFNRGEKIRNIRRLNYICVRLAYQAKKVTNNTYYQKLKKVMEDKDAILNSFNSGEHNYLKGKIVEQSMNLVVSYVKLLTNFCLRSRDIASKDTGEIINRMNMNARKLSFEKDFQKAGDIRKSIEMDEKMVERVKSEKQELDRLNYKLDYLESSISMLKHQMLTSTESDEMLEKLETVVNEAEALDNVLEDRRKNRRSMFN